MCLWVWFYGFEKSVPCVFFFFLIKYIWCLCEEEKKEKEEKNGHWSESVKKKKGKKKKEEEKGALGVTLHWQWVPCMWVQLRKCHRNWVLETKIRELSDGNKNWKQYQTHFSVVGPTIFEL